MAVVPGGPRDYTRTGHPTTALLIVEISETTLAYDRGRKASLYARAKIADYWIVNLVHSRLEVRRNPVPDQGERYGWRYQDVLLLGRRTASPPSPPRKSASPSPTCCRRGSVPTLLDARPSRYL